MASSRRCPLCPWVLVCVFLVESLLCHARGRAQQGRLHLALVPVPPRPGRLPPRILPKPPLSRLASTWCWYGWWCATPRDTPSLASRKKTSSIYDVAQWRVAQRETPGPLTSASAAGSESTSVFYEVNNGFTNFPRHAAVGGVQGFADTTPKAILLRVPFPSGANQPLAKSV
jgi:hypothetical protein